VNYWLIKSEPETFGIGDLESSPQRKTHWDGVRNYQARNFIRNEMKQGDRSFFYHSNCAQPGIVGIVEIVREAYPDHTAFDPQDAHYDPKSDVHDPRWYMMDVQLQRILNRTITLAELKEHSNGALRGFDLLRRGNRLSIMPVSVEQWQFILALE
jgi:predicted RNA-binding protein with PUA-like domain